MDDDKKSGEVTSELLYEILKQIQGDIAHLKTGQHDLKQGQIRIRNEVHGLKGDILRLEQSNAEIDTRLSRIEKRLDLVDA